MNKKIIVYIIILVLIIGGFSYYFLKNQKGSTSKINQPLLNFKKNMDLTSPVFLNNQFIPSKYTCDGEDINPPLNISGVPEGTESLVLIVDDPDAPMGTWDHWIVWNINPETSEIKENEVPEGAVEGINSFKKHSYGGPCPPSGIHHYHFKLYALNKKIEIGSSSGKKDVEKAMDGFIISKAELVGLYQKK